MSEPHPLHLRYFSDPLRQRTLAAGEQLLEQGEHNDRLYLLRSGRVEGTIMAESERQRVPIMIVEAGNYLGVHSYFSRGASYCRLVAQEPCELAWLDRNTLPVEPERFGSLADQFMPVIMAELAQRQRKVNHAYLERTRTQLRLLEAEKLSLLGQLAAGLAHELNNAIGVVTRNGSGLVDFLGDMLRQYYPREFRLFRQGLEAGQLSSSAEVRRDARRLEEQFRLAPEQAKLLARILNGEQPTRARMRDLLGVANYWQLGRDCHDMQLAVNHAAAIVRSVKQLGGADGERRHGVKVRDTLEQALALLQSSLRQVQVEPVLEGDPRLCANEAELVQVWANILKNALDALQATADPRIWLHCRTHGEWIEVTLANNGPVIPPELQPRIFKPNVTTKRGGLSFGLGLGLAIAERVVTSYGGEISLVSEPGLTAFKVRLPREYGQDESDMCG
ncbi:histidine kinase [Aeromonas salmonicida]|uniref:histidine kinase n=1 Tax=Aeromonas salmonicida subsp. pectinolytica 34mel TaxID=1324960 RepID=T0QN57_AERSA|nr:ATP-binding protein [Aeromonas salmonicida]ATP10960.1 sensor histidine kinase [Aeromonas salmonicida subsp. pectinolytica 34mel]EQC03029.1 sensory transduction protein kinase [Aeromonas salmonicida subsp. pectinolytica 34mel]TNI22470.1 histidine kinase [Aeromonas salmonicida]WCH28054.1 ATP-binding protein [Aeromonas salmonicida]HDN9021839.1 cyclic nucleotide-binding domain-containing protein [Aeromonas salmonicida]